MKTTDTTQQETRSPSLGEANTYDSSALALLPNVGQSRDLLNNHRAPMGLEAVREEESSDSLSGTLSLE